MSVRNVIFLAESSNVHVVRWLQKLNENFECVILVTAEEFKENDTLNTLDDYLVNMINDLDKFGKTILICGPLNFLMHQKNIPSCPIFGLSWGFDLDLNRLDDLNRQKLVISLKKYHGIIVDCNVNRNVLVDNGYDQKRIFVIPWGVDFGQNELIKTKNKNSFQLERAVFITTRRHEEIFNHHVILTAFKMINQRFKLTKLIVTNTGASTSQIEKFIFDNGLFDSVNLLGEIPEHKLLMQMSKSDLYLNASETDGSSVSLLQAMSLGVVPISSNVGGTSEWIDHGITGFLLPNIDSQSMYNEILKFSNSSHYFKMSKNCADKIKNDANWHDNFNSLLHFLKN
jgi:glycosyltransferase involved in cell wall biosynthesis